MPIRWTCGAERHRRSFHCIYLARRSDSTAQIWSDRSSPNVGRLPYRSG